MALFELAVLELRAEHNGEGGASSSSEEEEEEEGNSYGARELRVRVNALALDGPARARWNRVLKDAAALLDSAMSLSGSDVDLSSRLESRVAMLRDEIGLKREMIGGS